MEVALHQASRLHRRVPAAAAVLFALAVAPWVLTQTDLSFYIGVATRIVIFAIAAVSLDLILGYGGMVSLGHAAYLGIGAYAVGILSFYGLTNGFLQFGVAILASGIAALVIGSISVRTKGIHFIMITLAFGQMLYYLAVGISIYGGDDGLSIASNSNFGPLDLSDPIVLYYVSFGVLIAVLIALDRLVRSRFGVVFQAAKSNEQRLAAIGFSAYWFKLTAFVISGMVCGLAGALLANQNLFISPASMQWERSGELLIITILGGLGSLTGPVMGSVLYFLLEYFLSQATEHWQVPLGFVILAVALFGAGGLHRLLGHGNKATRSQT